MNGRLATMSRFDESVPEPKVVAECVKCHDDIYVGDVAHRIDDSVDFVCDDCASEYAMERVYDRYGIVDANGELE